MIVQGKLILDPTQPPTPGWLAIDGDRIVEVGEGTPPEKPAAGDAGCLVCPAFIDAHLHLPQFDSIGCDGLDLLDWLERVILPAEARWSDVEVARAQCLRAYAQLVRAGTFGFAGYLTSHAHSVVAATRAAHEIPLRAIVGQVLMDRHGPDELIGHEPARLSRSERGRMETSLNPRFAVSCSDALLAETGRRLALGFPHSFKQRDAGEMGIDLKLQTHLAESRRECEFVHERFPDDAHYTAVYDRHGLLTEHTLLAHCVHLGEAEWDLIAQRWSVVVHCPGANVFLRSGVFDLRAAREHGVRLALGSDVAAGPDLAMPRVARAMIDTAKQRKMCIDEQAVIPSPAEAWNLITRGNAEALGWHDAGRLEAGAAADVLVLRAPVDVDEHLIGRLIYTWRDDYVAQRILRGVLMA